MTTPNPLHLEALQNCLSNLEETIGRLFALASSLPAGQLRDKLMDEVSCLDSILDVTRKVAEAIEGESREG